MHQQSRQSLALRKQFHVVCYREEHVGLSAHNMQHIPVLCYS